jgi:spermidine/putrescine transport system permease protein
VLGTMIAFALARHRFRGRTATNLTIFLPMATPEVVLGASLLALFLNLKINLGFNTIVISHVMFCISFVVVTVKARIAGLDPRLEQAAMDLYADEFQTFRRITLPLVATRHRGRGAAGLLAVVRRLHHHQLQLRATSTPSRSSSTVSSLRGIPRRPTSSPSACSSSH